MNDDQYNEYEYNNENEQYGWPGDGSGEDDLADMMAHGDEGCCDEPEHFYEAEAGADEDYYADTPMGDEYGGE